MSKLPPIELSRKERTVLVRELRRRANQYDYLIGCANAERCSPDYLAGLKSKMDDCHQLIAKLKAKGTP